MLGYLFKRRNFKKALNGTPELQNPCLRGSYLKKCSVGSK